ncbi:MAG: acyl-CoA thioesterase, partial [Calditrichaeota bacterium]|nr:acyl-CoA thioesterase [Calditrichota bacterium]
MRDIKMNPTGFTKEYEIRWCDVDPNMHMRHTVIGDITDHIRGVYFEQHDISFQKLREMMVGPVLLQYSVRFLREVMMYEKVLVEFQIKSLSRDLRKFRFYHRIYKMDGQIAAEVEVFGAWMDLVKRKITVPPDLVRGVLDHAPMADNFEW